MLKEIWKEVPHWEEYLVSNYGRCYSKITNRIKSMDVNTSGYYRITFYKNKKHKTMFMHRVVALLFVSGYFPKALVNHIDGNKQNNVASNLEWVTASDNCTHGYYTKLRIAKHESCPMQCLDINTMDILSFKTIIALARYYGLTDQRVHHRLNLYSGYIPEVNIYVWRMSND